MNRTSDRPVPAAWRWFFLVAAAYDMALGLAFMVGGERILDAIGMEVPPHVAYIQLAAVFITVQGLSYLLPWHDPWANEGVVWVGVAYKASYAALAGWYLVMGMLPSMFFVPWAALDVCFMIGFLVFLREARRQRSG
ncbi:MAG TPA: hypothetical protein VFX74_02540 [Candidatus Limnocylindria bacterium]|nr:hypothetical protein [Candidatus Limnocylindria bacterium]